MKLLRGMKGFAPRQGGKFRCTTAVSLFSIISVAAALAAGSGKALEAQSAPPSDMEFHCGPNPLYAYTTANCLAHVGGGSTGSVSLSIEGTALGSFPLDSSGNAYGSTGMFSPGPGIYVLTATYSGDATHTSMSRDEGLTVYANKAIVTAETLSCLPYAVVAGQPVSCMVHIPGGATGTVAFQIDGAAWAGASVDANGNATVSNGLAGSTVGPHTISADYSGDSNFGGFHASTTESVYFQKPQPSTMSVGCTPSQIAAGQSATCKVHLTGGPTGTVDLYAHDQYWTTVTLDSNGNGSSAAGLSDLSPGTYVVAAMYNGDANFDTASAATTINIAGSVSTPSSSVSCSPSALTPGQGTNCTAQLPAGATGNVLFYVAGNYWTTVALAADGTATAVNGLYSLPAGSYAVTTYYSGDQNYSSVNGSSTGATVPIAAAKTAPPVTLACSPASLTSGSVTTCTANVGGGATGAVLFSINGAVNEGLGLDSTGKVLFQNQFQGAGIGTYSVQAAYQGDQNYSAAAGNNTVTVSSTPSVPSIQASISPSAVASGGQVNVMAHVGGGATGSVQISVNGGYIIQLPLNANGDVVGAEHLTGATSGSYNVSFTYLGDSNFQQTSTSQLLTVTNSSGSQPPPPAPGNPPTPGTALYYYSITAANGGTGFDPVGNTVAYQDSVNGSWTAGYDQTNRLVGATQAQVNGQPSLVYPSVTQQTFCWLYDSFGNRLQQAISDQSFSTGCQATSPHVTRTTANYDPNAANNRVSTVANGTVTSSYVYDDSGNVLDDGSNQYVYDGDGRVCASLNKVLGQMTGYLYDADGERVAKGTLSTLSCDVLTNGFALTNEFLRGPSGEQLTELNGSGQLLHTNAFAGGDLVATYDSQLAVHFSLNDWLGTRRLQTDYKGSAERLCSSGSFGDLLNCQGSGDATAQTEIHFTGKERDTESGLDYFGARYYGSNMGRFMSPDWSKYPEAVPYASFTNPQSLNLYSYVGNNPLRFKDSTGHSCDPDTSSTDSRTGAVTVTAGACHPDWWQFQGVRRWIGQHPKTVKTTFAVVNTATVVSGLLDGGASELAVPEELAAEEALIESSEALEATWPESESELGHIFRESEGHVADTPANRELLHDVANDPGAKLGPDKYGNQWSAKTTPDGKQAWVQTRGGKIVNGGINETPRTYNPQTGLKKP